jgi:class 3 adenylate cyclase
MFCDLVNSTALSEALDAEDLRTVVTRYQASCAAAIESVGGVVAQYLGDGLLVYFGYPQANEDDAIRAVRAALRILDLMPALNVRLERELPDLVIPERLRIRIGIHTGPIVIGTIGDGDRREQLALGETVNVAARLQGEAEPDTALISDATRRLLRGAFLLVDSGERVLKGISNPLSVFQPLQGLDDRGDLQSAPPTLPPVVGREHEIAFLADRWEKAREGRGQGVLISSEAGLGKSRLVQALRERETCKSQSNDGYVNPDMGNPAASPAKLQC